MPQKYRKMFRVNKLRAYMLEARKIFYTLDE